MCEKCGDPNHVVVSSDVKLGWKQIGCLAVGLPTMLAMFWCFHADPGHAPTPAPPPDKCELAKARLSWLKTNYDRATVNQAYVSPDARLSFDAERAQPPSTLFSREWVDDIFPLSLRKQRATVRLDCGVDE